MVDPDGEEIYHGPAFGCKLVGMIPVSDAFGVDLIVTKYEEALKKREEEKELQNRRNETPHYTDPYTTRI